ncbi:LOW QUALITY PROTEIN: polyprotein [Phytophthora megakarya]|uniref:Polyprotein n=1 Tax=Phytophthora megakarya TaxID=4795 RepID=A0A225VTI1_9STRA|nr:LOW QUALITY PROTEIN: polyprotein [Phytophthora megakarya]
MVLWQQNLLLVLQCLMNSSTTSGSDSRLIVLSLHVDGAKRSIRPLLNSGVTNNFVHAEGLPVLPTDIFIREGPGHSVRASRGGPRRSATFSYEYGGFCESDGFMIIELDGSFDCIFGKPLARSSPAPYSLSNHDCPSA